MGIGNDVVGLGLGKFQSVVHSKEVVRGMGLEDEEVLGNDRDHLDSHDRYIAGHLGNKHQGNHQSDVMQD